MNYPASTTAIASVGITGILSLSQMDCVGAPCALIEGMLQACRQVLNGDYETNAKKILLVYRHTKLDEKQLAASLRERSQKLEKHEVRVLYQDAHTYVSLGSEKKLREIRTGMFDFEGECPHVYIPTKTQWREIQGHAGDQTSAPEAPVAEAPAIKERESEVLQVTPADVRSWSPIPVCARDPNRVIRIRPPEPEIPTPLRMLRVVIPRNLPNLSNLDWRNGVLAEMRFHREFSPLRMKHRTFDLPGNVHVVVTTSGCGRTSFIRHLASEYPESVHVISGLPEETYLRSLWEIPRWEWNKDILVIDYVRRGAGEAYTNSLKTLFGHIDNCVPGGCILPSDVPNVNCPIWAFVGPIFPALLDWGGRWKIYVVPSPGSERSRQLVRVGN